MPGRHSRRLSLGRRCRLLGLVLSDPIDLDIILATASNGACYQQANSSYGNQEAHTEGQRIHAIFVLFCKRECKSLS